MSCDLNLRLGRNRQPRWTCEPPAPGGWNAKVHEYNLRTHLECKVKSLLHALASREIPSSFCRAVDHAINPWQIDLGEETVTLTDGVVEAGQLFAARRA
jgi:hypothetical protein